MMSYQPQTEAATSRFLNVEEGGETLRIHFNDCGRGMKPWSCCTAPALAPPAGPTLAAISTRWWRRATGSFCWTAPAGEKRFIVNRGSRSDLNARVLKSVVDQLDISKVHLLGNSMGGHSAVALP
jgi:2-hydroxy-6-oxonona-2,4-dienedioate hydrolase